jgi:polyhydroxybutyrate depolymerase
VIPKALWLVLAAALVTSSTGCGGAPADSSATDHTTAVGSSQAGGNRADIDGTLVVDGRTRTYHVHLPPAWAATPRPLLIGLHGGLGSGLQFAENTRMNDLADARQFIAVYPDGVGGVAGNDELRTWNGGVCCGVAAREDVDDVSFISALIDELSNTYSIDATRVFAVGHSNGGIMAYRLACELADRIVAIGVYAATSGLEVCSPSVPVSLIHVHGTADQNLPIEGGHGERSLAGVDFPAPIDGITGVARADGCAGTSDQIDGDVTTQTWTDCAAGTEVRFVAIAGASHAWPGGTGPGAEQLVGPAYAGYDASTEIWTFLTAHPRLGSG